jgi:hypothetical protein
VPELPAIDIRLGQRVVRLAQGRHPGIQDRDREARRTGDGKARESESATALIGAILVLRSVNAKWTPSPAIDTPPPSDATTSTVTFSKPPSVQRSRKGRVAGSVGFRS